MLGPVVVCIVPCLTFRTLALTTAVALQTAEAAVREVAAAVAVPMKMLQVLLDVAVVLKGNTCWC